MTAVARNADFASSEDGSPHRRWTIAKWLGSSSLMAILVAFLFSTGRSLSWCSEGSRNEVSLIEGCVAFGWRPDGWTIENDPYAPKPGWSMRGYSAAPNLLHWINVSNGKKWNGLAIPLYVPFGLILAPTALLWRRQWSQTRRWRRRLFDRLTPSSPQRMSWPLWLLFCGGHILAVCLLDCAASLVHWLYQEPIPPDVPTLIMAPLHIRLGLAAPLCAILWAWLWVRFRNSLHAHRQGQPCTNCGYDLTGNVTGICSECGKPCEATATTEIEMPS